MTHTARIGSIAVLVALQVACVLGGGGRDTNGAMTDYDQPVILGIWVRETDDRHYVVREFYEGEPFLATGERTTRDYYYPVGDEPIVRSGGVYYVEDGKTLPGGEVADDVLSIYQQVGLVSPYVTYEKIVRVKDDKLVLQGLFDEEPTEYAAADALP